MLLVRLHLVISLNMRVNIKYFLNKFEVLSFNILNLLSSYLIIHGLNRLQCVVCLDVQSNLGRALPYMLLLALFALNVLRDLVVRFD